MKCPSFPGDGGLGQVIEAPAFNGWYAGYQFRGIQEARLWEIFLLVSPPCSGKKILLGAFSSPQSFKGSRSSHFPLRSEGRPPPPVVITLWINYTQMHKLLGFLSVIRAPGVSSAAVSQKRYQVCTTWALKQHQEPQWYIFKSVWYIQLIPFNCYTAMNMNAMNFIKPFPYWKIFRFLQIFHYYIYIIYNNITLYLHSFFHLLRCV